MPRKQLARPTHKPTHGRRFTTEQLNSRGSSGLRTIVRAILPRISLPEDRERLRQAQSEITFRSNKQEQKCTLLYHGHEDTSPLQLVRRLLHRLDIRLVDPLETALREEQKRVLREIARLTGRPVVCIPLSVAILEGTKDVTSGSSPQPSA